MLLEAPANIPASAWLLNRSTGPGAPAASAGILIDLPEAVVTTVHEPPTAVSVEIDPAHHSGVPAGIADETDRSNLRAAARRIWLVALERIRPQLSAQTMRTWFEPLEAVTVEGAEITLRAPSSFFCEWIGEHYQDILEQALRDVLGPSARYRFDTVTEVESVNTKLEVATIPPAPVPAPQASNSASPFMAPKTDAFVARPNTQPSTATPRPTQTAAPAAAHPAASNKQPVFDSLLNPRYTFDTFIRGESNKLAYGAAMAVANNPGGTRYNPLVIYGNVGLGKTHLIQAVGHAAMQKFPSAKVLYTSSERFTVEFVDAIQNDRINEFQAMYRSIDVLIIDDVQFFAGKEKTQDIFFHTFNALRELGKQIILTCDRPPKELK
ncbi:MAG: DnaA ATPase domain-containing protein, partial [Acidobacteriaceae bacterium]